MTPDHLEEGRYRLVRRDVRVPSCEKLLSHNHIFIRARGASARVELDDPLGSDVVVFAGSQPAARFPVLVAIPTIADTCFFCLLCVFWDRLRCVWDAGTRDSELSPLQAIGYSPGSTISDDSRCSASMGLRLWKPPQTAAQRMRTAAESLLDCAAKMATIKYAIDQ
ncbi:hypothetical protein GQ607_001132 [Colletotrichum asianum]|uniref:Uncharacterized protein n=1 Tax=Colletotrichum asianum TaxID=702518 RepID=A0A8H3WSR0_9PEZI|nr:hypothetical protein GQ607_001132 [Colletotrichum asianum]